MVEYTCEKCGKTFKQKGHYTKHLNRKRPCDNIKKNVEKVLENMVNAVVKEQLLQLVESGDIEIKNKDIISSDQNNIMAEKKGIKTLDLFCGCGGFFVPR